MTAKATYEKYINQVGAMGNIEGAIISGQYPADVMNGLTLALKIVRNTTLEDVAPVVHAHWVEFENPNYSPFDNSPEKIVLCSHCNNGHGTKDDYCCVCGAKMDEVVE